MNIRSSLLLLPLLLLSHNLVDASERIVGIGIAKNDHVYVWFADGKVTSGTTSNFEKYRHAYSYSLPPGKTPDDIVAISIAGSNDHVYAWYKDGYVSSGTSDDLDQYRAPYKYTLPSRKTVKDILGIGIAGSDDHVYAWYDDGKWSSGTTDDLDSYAGLSSYSLPSGQTAADIVEIDIAKSNDHVYAWYRNGIVSAGSFNNLSRHRSFGYVPSQVLYRWWGPAATNLKAGPVNLSEKSVSDKGPLSQAATAEPYSTISKLTQLELKNEPADSAILSQSPNWSEPRFTSDTGGSIDPMIAVGNQYLITSDTTSIAFYDKQGNLLPVKNGMPTRLSATQFFEGFLAETNADGSFNESNINHYLQFPKPCDSPDYPQTSSGKRFCIDVFYDTRVFFDATSKRFFVISNSRHPLWAAAKYEAKYGTCGVYTNSSGVNVGTDDYCDLARRYIAFAVSKTEDPRDGFHQYMITESNNRDFPWMAVNGNAFIVAHKGSESTIAPVATVLSVNAVKSGDQHPPYFSYYVQDLGGVTAAIPPAHYQNSTGLSFLLAGSDNRIDIFAFRQPTDPWTAPPLLKTSVNLSEGISFYNAVYRSGKLYLVGNKLVEENGAAKRYSVRLVRVPIEQPSASSIKAATSSSKGFLDWFFGRNSHADPSGSLISYEKPALAVNKNGDMLFAYGRYPFSPANSLNPEARYTYWFANEAKQRPSHLLQAGTALNSESIISALDYATVVVDPSNDLTFWMAAPYSIGTGYKTVIGKVVP
jgi:hypothetical protein